MCYISEIHSKFVKRAINSSQLIANNAASGIPTYLFLIASFVLIYQHLHRTSSRHTRWKTRMTRDLKFHWIFFNVTRLWYILLSCFKRFIIVAEEYIEAVIPENDKEFNQLLTYTAALIIVTSLAVIPVLLIYVSCVSRNDMPNFLMWVMEDPYLRHEIGISGHCLERPLRIDPQKMKNYSYRSRRSTSFDANPWLSPQKSAVLCRNCKSMMEHNVVNSIEELLD